MAHAVLLAGLLARGTPDAVALAPGGAPKPLWRGLVLVLSPPVEDETTRSAMVRIVGEFGAALFQVITRPVDPTIDLMVQLEKAGNDLSPLAAFAIVRDPDEGSAGVAVWVSNRMTRTTTVQRMQLRTRDIDRAAAQLAVETVDLVRASVAGLWPIEASSHARAADQPRDDAAAVRTPDAGSPGWAPFRLAVGVGFFGDFNAVPSVWAPEVALWYGRPDRLGVRVSLAGLGPGAGVTASDGTGARLQRAMLSVGMVRLFRSDRRLQPILSAAAGLHRLGAQGTGAASDREHDRSAYSALLSAGAGLAVALGAHLALTAEAEALWLLPSVVVRVGQEESARLHRSSIFAHAGLLASF